jgi:hypothetical protein
MLTVIIVIVVPLGADSYASNTAIFQFFCTGFPRVKFIARIKG